MMKLFVTLNGRVERWFKCQKEFWWWTTGFQPFLKQLEQKGEHLDDVAAHLVATAPWRWKMQLIGLYHLLWSVNSFSYSNTGKNMTENSLCLLRCRFCSYLFK